MPSTRRSTPTPCEGPRPWARGSREAWGRGATANGYLVPRRNAGGATRGPGPAEMVWCVRARWAGGKATRARSDDSNEEKATTTTTKRRKPKTTSYYKMTDLVCECRSSCDENDPRHTVRVSPSPHPSPLTTAARSPNLSPLWNLLFAACLPGEGWGVGAARTPSTRPSRVLIPTPWWNIYPPRQPSVVVVESADSFPFLIDLIVAPTDSKVRKHGGWPSESGGGR